MLTSEHAGSTGKERGDRHPKVGSNVLIGANVTILGKSINCVSRHATLSFVSHFDKRQVSGQIRLV